MAVFMGGFSSEREVSILSGNEVIKSLNRKKFDIFPIIISPELSWLDGINKAKNNEVDVAFIAIHGRDGEDGMLQGALHLAGIPYTGPGVLASAIGMDKIRFKKLLASDGVVFPKYHIHTSSQELDQNIFSDGCIHVVKPHNQGSSVGVSLVKNKFELVNAINLAHKYSDYVLIEEYIKGKEIACAVLGNNNPEVLPIVEIIPDHEFFDYESKYTSQKTREIVPAKIDDKLTALVNSLTLQIYKHMGARGFARVDYILKDDKVPYCLEANTIPGLTSASLFPKAAKAAGISYQELVEKIIQLAMEQTP